MYVEEEREEGSLQAKGVLREQGQKRAGEWEGKDGRPAWRIRRPITHTYLNSIYKDSFQMSAKNIHDVTTAQKLSV